MVNNNGSDEAIRVLVEQYKENMKTLIQEGKLSHGSLEQHLSFVIGSVNEEIKKITEDLIKEEEIKKNCCCPHCGKETRINVKAAKIEVLTTQGPIEVHRDWYVCRTCGEGFSPVDTMLGLGKTGHKMTPETIKTPN